MARLAASDAARLRAIEGELGTLREGGPSALAWIVSAARDLLGAETVCAITYAPRGEGLTVRGHAVGVTPDFLPYTDAWLQDRKVGWTFHNPMRPPPAERNVVLSTGEIMDRTGRSHAPILDVYRRFGLPALTHVRAMVCEGASLLAWVGIWQQARIEARQRRIFQRLVAPLQRRLASERLLADGATLRTALGVALESVPCPAFLVSADGTVREANAAGAAWLEHDRRARLAAMGDAVRRSRDPRGTFRVTRVSGAGASATFFVLARADASSAYASAAAALAWGFTPREKCVLDLLGEGLTTRTIAADLGVSERAIEARLTSMYSKAQVETRAELVARAWRRG